MGVEQDLRGSKLERVKKKQTTLFISDNKFFQVALGVEGRRAVERGWSRLRNTQLGEFNDLFDRDKAVPIQ